ncbi:hypothetical protein AB0F44_13255 [Nocardioides sp. NPDC023903]|uniref:hypothetical protein n=1 Tax=Nocardioides sp. NPDC023903 TaxID=3157195 RepID=UPI0033FDFC2F
MSAAEAKPEAIQSAANDVVTPELDEPNEATVIRKPVEATAPEAVEDEPDAAQTSLSLPRISAYGDDNVPGPASSATATKPNDEPTERTSRRQAPSVEEKLDTDEPDGTTALRPAYAPPTAPPPTTPPPAHEPAAATEAVIPDPEPSPIPDPSPFPEPTPVPGPDPVPDPEPTPEPPPEPGPLPGPEPVPEPEPVSVATAEVAYQPFVQPSGMLVQESRNGKARHWAPPEETPADQVYETEPAYATGYAEEAYATEDAGEWQTGYGYAGEPEPLEQDFGDYGAQQEYVSSLMASETEDNPSTWIVLLWVGAIFMIVMLVLGIWLMTL